MGVFFCKKWAFPQLRVHYVQYQYFFILHFTYWGWGCVRTQRTPPPAYGPALCCVCAAAETERSGRTGGDVILMSSLILVCVCIIISIAGLVLFARRRRPTSR